jgi:outer membrane biosynthesis protein TonB
MAEPIEANYIPDGDDWTITIKGRGRTLKATAPGIIAARDRTDQLVEELAPDDEYRTVVHLLNGDAVEFTTAYLTARMTTKSEPPPPAEPEEPEVPAQPEPAAEAAPEAKPARKTPSPRPREPEEAAADEVPSPSAS